MIPHSVKRNHILAAIEEIDRTGVPEGRASKKYLLMHSKRPYPPKYVVGRAAYFATGEELDPGSFNGGNETNSYLRNLGFTVVENANILRGTDRRNVENEVALITTPLRDRHDERCPECKKRIRELLFKIYAQTEAVQSQHRIPLDPRLESYRGSPHFAALEKIFTALTEHRGYTGFVKTTALSPCDLFVDPPGLVVETDESQHFTIPRAISLEHYPTDMALGFDRSEWQRRARELSRSDHHPIYRDEQRAWYDTIRDFAPLLCEQVKRPTVRIFLGRYPWCELDSHRQQDVDKFSHITGLYNNNSKGVASLSRQTRRVVPLVDDVMKDLRLMEYFFQEIRLLYLRWVSDPEFRPPKRRIAKLLPGDYYKVFESFNGNAFSLSPCGKGSAYLGGGEGAVTMPPGCYPENTVLQSRTAIAKRNLKEALSRIRSMLLMLLERNEDAQVWGLLQDFYWLKLGVHEFAFDLTYRYADAATWSCYTGVRDILVESMQVGQDLRECYQNHLESKAGLIAFISKLKWNNYACCAFDCGPISIARDRHVTFAEFAKHRSQFDVPSTNEPPEARAAWPKNVLGKQYDLLLCYNNDLPEPEYSIWRANSETVARILDDVESRLAQYRAVCVGA